MTTNKLIEVGVVCLIGVLLVMCAIATCYIPSLLSAEIAYKRAAAKALSGLDLRDEETRRALRSLFGQEEGKGKR